MDIFTRYLRVDSWLGLFCEYNLISHASAFSIRTHPLKVVTLFVTYNIIFIFQAPAHFFLTATDLAF